VLSIKGSMELVSPAVHVYTSRVSVNRRMKANEEGSGVTAIKFFGYDEVGNGSRWYHGSDNDGTLAHGTHHCQWQSKSDKSDKSPCHHLMITQTTAN
jgi:hypothetical protein